MEAPPLKTFSPKELAQIVGVSESSIKRWVDDALIRVTRTAGGHRRIRLQDALHFIRDRNLHVLRPDLLGLPTTGAVRPSEAPGAGLLHLLRHGRSVDVRNALAQQYATGTPLAVLFDEQIAGAMEVLGTLWEEDAAGIFIEHRATAACIEAVSHLRGLLPTPPPDAPVAIGGAPPGDPYLLPSLMAATVFAEAGFADVNLGPDTPADSFLRAADVHHPQMVWIAMTSPLNATRADVLARDLFQPLLDAGVEVVVGGQQSARWADRWPAPTCIIPSMGALAAHLATRQSDR